MAFIGDKKISFSPRFHITEGGADYNEGYSAGYENGKEQGKEIGRTEGIEQGKQNEYDKFWDAYQQNGERGYYYYAFAYQWNDECYNPKYPIVCGTSTTDGQNVFRSSDITDTKVPIEIQYSGQAMFYACPNLKTIRKLIVNENTIFTNMFYTTYTVENITIEGVIGKDFSIRGNPLTKESFISVINALSPTVTDKTVTFSKIYVDSAFETAEGLADGSTSEEWLALVNSKPNWTIAI